MFDSLSLPQPSTSAIIQCTVSSFHVHVDVLLESLLGRLPVDNIPDSAEVFGLAVLVLKVVCVLPRVNSEQGAELANDRILVRICSDLNGASLGVLH